MFPAITNVRCYGEETGSVSISTSGGTPDYHYSMSGMDSNTGIAYNLAPNTYTVNVVDANGCQAALNFTITQNSMHTLFFFYIYLLLFISFM